jgi:hypothetical protein
MYSGSGLHIEIYTYGRLEVSERTYLCGMVCAVLSSMVFIATYALLVAYYFTI